MSRELVTHSAPVLPEAGSEYLPGFFSQYSNVLRLFFNRLLNTINALLGEDGGSLLESPSGAFYDLTNQTAALANTAYPVTFNTTSERRVTLASSSRATVSVGGLYQFAVTVQFSKATAGAAGAYLWLRKNGTTAIAGTAALFGITGSGVTDGVACNYLLELVEDDYVEVLFAVSDTAVTLQTIAAVGAVPAVPSAILNVAYASMVRP